MAFYDVVFFNKTFKIGTLFSQSLASGIYNQEHNVTAFWPVIEAEQTVLEEPLYEFIKHSLRKGFIPLWNPYQACGYALIGMIQVGMFFPLNWILYLLPNLIAWDVMTLTRFFLAGIFTYWFMRTLRFGKIPSLTSAICFMLSGPMLTFQLWVVNVDLLTPLLLLAIERMLRQTKSSSLAFLAFVVALTVYAGHPEHIFLVNFYGVCYFVFRLIVLRKKTNPHKSILFFILAYLLGIGLSSATLFPFLRNLSTEFWHAHPEKVGLLLEENPGRAITLALPHFFQKMPMTKEWVLAGWWGAYLGVLPLALAFISLFNKQRKGLNYFLFSLAFILLGKAYTLPVINWIGYLPLFNVCRWAIHTPHLIAFTVAVLAGMGMRTILNSRQVFLKGSVYSLLLAVIILIHLIILKGADHHLLSRKASYFAVGILVIYQLILFFKDKRILKKKAIAVLLSLALFAELFLYINRERPFRFDSYAKVPYIEFLKKQKPRPRSYGLFWNLFPNAATGFGIDDLGYFFGLVPKRYVTFCNSLIDKELFKDDLSPPTLRVKPLEHRAHIIDLLNVKYLIAPAREEFKKPFPIVYEGEVLVVERPQALPRAYIIHRAVFETDEQKALQAVDQLMDQKSTVAVINHPNDKQLFDYLNQQPLKDNSSAKVVSYEPNEVQIKATVENPGFLVLTDAFHPDWKVFVNGEEEKIYQTNYLLRSVFLPRGRHDVRFVFKPASFFWGLWVSLFSLLILLFIYFKPRFKKIN